MLFLRKSVQTLQVIRSCVNAQKVCALSVTVVFQTSVLYGVKLLQVSSFSESSRSNPRSKHFVHCLNEAALALHVHEQMYLKLLLLFYRPYYHYIVVVDRRPGCSSRRQ